MSTRDLPAVRADLPGSHDLHAWKQATRPSSRPLPRRASMVPASPAQLAAEAAAEAEAQALAMAARQGGTLEQGSRGAHAAPDLDLDPSDPAGFDPVGPDPARFDPVQADPLPADPVQADPVQAAPVATAPAPRTDPAAAGSGTVDPAGGAPAQGPLAVPELAPLWAAVRESLSRSGKHADPVIPVRGLDSTGRRALADLLGVPPSRGLLRVNVEALEAAVLAATGSSLRDAVQSLPVEAAVRSRRRGGSPAGASSWRLAQEWLDEHPAIGERRWVPGWLEALQRDLGDSGLRPEQLLQALEVLSAVLDDGAGSWRVRVELASFAAGDIRALDDGSPVAAAVLRALAAASGVPTPTDAMARRALWGRHGVLPDLLTMTTLAVGIAPAGDQGGRRWRIAAIEGAPVHITARDLRAHAEPWVAVDEAWPYVIVCENPRVVQSLAEHFAGRVPAICTNGTPEPLVVELLHRLRTSGAELRFHGDLDWPGVASANLLLHKCRAQPWRMSAQDYEAAVSPSLPLLTGPRVEPAWDGDLAGLMASTGRAVPEEHVLPDLVGAVRAEVR